MSPLYLLMIVFLKFDPLTDIQGWLYISKFQNLFSLYRVSAESSLAYTETKRNKAYTQYKLKSIPLSLSIS